MAVSVEMRTGDPFLLAKAAAVIEHVLSQRSETGGVRFWDRKRMTKGR
jgi:hypothetical protein